MKLSLVPFPHLFLFLCLGIKERSCLFYLFYDRGSFFQSYLVNPRKVTPLDNCHEHSVGRVYTSSVTLGAHTLPSSYSSSVISAVIFHWPQCSPACHLHLLLLQWEFLLFLDADMRAHRKNKG